MIFFTADLHLNHEKVILFTTRPFKSIVEHDEYVIARINNRVGQKDRLYVLGDVSWRAVGQELGKIVCKDIHLIWGNHDRQNFGKWFKTAEDVTEIKIGEQKVFLSHYPHAFWPSSHRGSMHLYGHCHSQREETLDKAFPGRRSMDVGIDNAWKLLGEYCPFSEGEIMDILGPRPGHDSVEYYEANHGAWNDNLRSN